MFTLLSLFFFILLFILTALWMLIPALYGLPSIPTKPNRIRRALQLVDLQPNEIFYDLGAGDGRVLLIAAREFNAKAVGIEVGPVQCALVWLRAAASGLGEKIKIRWADYLKSDLHEADVVFIYATSKEVMKLAKHLEKQMKPGSRLVSISADFTEWEPSSMDDRSLIFVYRMPPKRGNITTYLLKEMK